MDEVQQRIVVTEGTHKLRDSPLSVRRSVLLEGARLGSKPRLIADGRAAVVFEDAGLQGAIVRNLSISLSGSEGSGAQGAAVECRGLSQAEAGAAPATGPAPAPRLVACDITATGHWGTCIRVTDGGLHVVRCRLSSARWGAIIINGSDQCCIDECNMDDLGEDGLILVNGTPRVRRNKVRRCGGAGVRIVGQCCVTFEANEVRDCSVGMQVLDQRASVHCLPGNKLLHNGLGAGDQIAVPQGVTWSTHGHKVEQVAACRSGEMLPEADKDLIDELSSADPERLAVLFRAARRRRLWSQAAAAHARLWELCPDVHATGGSRTKLPISSVQPLPHHVLVASEAWSPDEERLRQGAVAVRPGALCAVLDESGGWLRAESSDGSPGWYNPRVLQ